MVQLFSSLLFHFFEFFPSPDSQVFALYHQDRSVTQTFLYFSLIVAFLVKYEFLFFFQKRVMREIAFNSHDNLLHLKFI